MIPSLTAQFGAEHVSGWRYRRLLKEALAVQCAW